MRICFVGVVVFRKRVTENHVNLCDSKVVWIDEICIDEKYRRKGIGKLLIQEVEKQAKENKCNQIELNCWECNENAIKFYESIGLKTQRRILEMKI